MTTTSLFSALAIILGLLFAGGAALAQEGTTDNAESDSQQESTEEAKPPMPELTGQVSGIADGRPFSGPVDCSGFTEADQVRVRTDPGGAVGEDLTGDGLVMDVIASRNRGTIDLNLKVRNTSFSFSGRLAKFTNNVMSYEVTLKSASGPDISISLKVDCTA